jgi:hypothetical protein
MEKKRAYIVAINQLFVEFKNPIIQLQEILYIIFIQFCIRMDVG